MVFHILTLFPEMIRQGMSPSIIGRAAEKGVILLDVVNIRDYTLDKHGKTDDYPYGGGAGMLMQAQPVYDAYAAVTGGRRVRTVYVTPQGTPFTQKLAREYAAEGELTFLCGHYEGIDERVLEEVVTDYVSIGDYVLTGGELAAMVMIDAIARLVPGVLGNELSAQEESFHNDLLEYPQYSRPEVWHGRRVPQVLLSGNHSRIADWRLEQARVRTQARRPDLYGKYQEKQALIKRLSRNKRNNIHMMESLARGRGEILYAREEDILLYDGGYRVALAEAADAASGERLAEMLPEDTEWIVTSSPFLKDMFVSRGYEASCGCEQVLYTRKVALPMGGGCVKRLSMDSLEYVRVHYAFGDFPGNRFPGGGVPGEGSSGVGYIRERIQAGVMYGIFAAGVRVGFVGMHIDGSLGMLFVEEAYRRQGLGETLEAYAVNRMLERGWTPYGYVPAGGEAAGLQEKLGFYKAGKTFWRFLKSACKQGGDMLR